MLPFIFTNVTQILRCRPDAHKGRIYNVSFLFFFFFPAVEIHQISVTLRWKTSIQALHPPLLPSSPPLPSLLPSPLSLLCTGVWSCFLMSSGTSGAITLSPSVVTLCTCCKALLIQPHVCIHSCTPAPEFPKWTKPPYSYRIKDHVKIVFYSLSWMCVTFMTSSFFFFFCCIRQPLAAESPRCQMLDQAFLCESHLMPDFCGPSQVCWMCVRASVLQRHSLQARVDGCICLCNWMCVCVCAAAWD